MNRLLQFEKEAFVPGDQGLYWALLCVMGPGPPCRRCCSSVRPSPASLSFVAPLLRPFALPWVSEWAPVLKQRLLGADGDRAPTSWAFPSSQLSEGASGWEGACVRERRGLVFIRRSGMLGLN